MTTKRKRFSTRGYMTGDCDACHERDALYFSSAGGGGAHCLWCWRVNLDREHGSTASQPDDAASFLEWVQEVGTPALYQRWAKRLAAWGLSAAR